MKAIVIREFGPPNVMRLEEVDDPTPGYEEVIVHLYLKQITVIGATGQMPADLVLSLHAAAQGRLKAIIACVLPLAQAPLAHELVESRAILGKVVLDPTQPPADGSPNVPGSGSRE